MRFLFCTEGSKLSEEAIQVGGRVPTAGFPLSNSTLASKTARPPHTSYVESQTGMTAKDSAVSTQLHPRREPS